MSASAVTPAFNCRVAEMASMLALQAPVADAHLDVLEELGHDVALFRESLCSSELFIADCGSLPRLGSIPKNTRHHSLTAVSNLRRLWLPLTVEASSTALRALIVGLDIEDPLASSQQFPPTVATVPEPSNTNKGNDRAKSPAADHSSNCSPLLPMRMKIFKTRQNPLVQMTGNTIQRLLLPLPHLWLNALSHKGRSSDELMQHYDMRDPCEVVRKCKRCTAKPSAKPCVTILRRNTKTGQFVQSERCLSCILEKTKCEWPAGAIIKNTERRVHVKSGHSSKDFSVAPKGLQSVLGQSSAPAHQVVSNLPHRNMVKATSSTRPAPGLSSATATKQAKHTPLSLPQLPTLKAEDDIDAIDVHACPYIKPEAIDIKIILGFVPVEDGDEEAVGHKVADGEGIDSELDEHVDLTRSHITSSSASGGTSHGPEYRTTGVQVDIEADIHADLSGNALSILRFTGTDFESEHSGH
ncbi:hypothetical protein BDR03DRAFT_1018072 [Suillus americanus]|nr:hypothetical protein BDR03DRAFT_1018072 [Suillus americanus]